MENELNSKSETIKHSPVWNIKIGLQAEAPSSIDFHKKKKLLRLQIVLN
jgi:hypothetical protein